MTDEQPICPRPRCGRPLHDGANICGPCTGCLRSDLRTVATTLVAKALDLYLPPAR